MILRISEARVCGPHSLRLAFNDGTTKQVDVRPLLDGPIFEPLRDSAVFCDHELGCDLWHGRLAEWCGFRTQSTL